MHRPMRTFYFAYTALIVFCLLWIGPGQLMAQRFSYVYIQGDQRTPFYVKFEGEMLPRYGKHYSIISALAPGPINLEILFQQHAYPPASFQVQVPEDGFRGFLLTRVDTGFALYDIHQHFYLRSGNEIDEDRMPDPMTGRPLASQRPNHSSASASAAAPSGSDPLRSAWESLVSRAEQIPEQLKTARASRQTESTPAPNSDQDLKFIDNLELRGAGQQDPPPPIPNSDCPEPLTNAAFESLYRNVVRRPADQRMAYLFEQTAVCLSTNQARQLTLSLSTDAEKYTFLKRIYSRITNQERFGELASLFEDPEWKSYFHQFILNP